MTAIVSSTPSVGGSAGEPGKHISHSHFYPLFFNCMVASFM